MKNLILISVVIMSLLAVKSFASTENLNLEEVFVIKSGFDSNDNVQVTLHAKLPSACYKTAVAKLDRVSDYKFKVVFKVKKKGLRGCEVSELNFPVNFTKTIDLGELPVGKYTVAYNVNEEKTFDIEDATNQSIDNNIYAPISSSFIPELVSNKRRAQVILTGIFPTNCMQLNPNKIQIKRVDNVFIVLPILDYEYNIDCRSVNLPLQAVVDLGKINEPGSYLVHIRSLSGMAVNKVFYVQDKNASPNGER